MAALMDLVQVNECSKQMEIHATKLITNHDNSDCVEVCVIDDSPLTKKIKVEDEKFTEATRSDRPLLVQGDDLIKLKKRLRERDKKIKNMPKLHLKELGQKASLHNSIEDRFPLLLSDIQSLIICSQLGIHWPHMIDRWYQLEKYTRLGSVTVLVIENLSVYHYQAFESCFNFVSSTFDYKVEVVTPFLYESDIIQELSMVPLTTSEMHMLLKKYGSLEEAAKNHCNVFNTKNHFFPIESADDHGEFDNKLKTSDKFPRTELLLSVWQMIEENFPLPIKGLMERKYIGYKLTKIKYKSVTLNSPLIAIDCEMCKTETGDLELTRISVVNEAHEVLLDTLVKPHNKITDYLTRFSGINAKMLKNVKTRLEDVQEQLISLLPEDAILIGHSLSNDLHALKMMHPYVIDTSVIYNTSGQRRHKTKLQTISRIFLKEHIQVGRNGHCSSEDSLACMKLTQLKLKNHVYFGDAAMNKAFPAQTKSVFSTGNFSTSLVHECTKSGNKVNIIGVDNNGDKYKYYVNKNMPKTIPNIEFQNSESNKNVINYLCEVLNKYNLNIGHLRVASDQINEDNHQNDREKIFKLIDKWIKKVYDAADEPSLIMVLFSGQKHVGNGVCFSNVKRTLIE